MVHVHAQLRADAGMSGASRGEVASAHPTSAPLTTAARKRADFRPEKSKDP